jgi:hypothetical protein
VARSGSASALVATLWVDHNLRPEDVLDAHPQVFASLCQILELRCRRAVAERKRQDFQEDMQAAARMHQALRGIS